MLSAICGGGAGLILMPILGAILPSTQIPAALSIGTFSSSASRLIVFFKSIRWHIVLYFMPPAIVAVVAGAFLLKFINPLYLQVVMGLFLMSNLTFLFKKTDLSATSEENISKVKIVTIGFLAGFLSGLTGAVGLLFNKFYLRHGFSKQQIMATRAANEILLHLIKFVMYTMLGLITREVLVLGALVALAAVLSTFLIKYVLPYISELLFKKIGYAAMVLSGMIMLLQSSNNLFVQNNGSLTYKPVAEGLEARLQWQNADYSLEFTYDEGLEFELIIPINELDAELQKQVQLQKADATSMVIEKVYALEGVSYEAYYFKNNQLLKKLDLE